MIRPWSAHAAYTAFAVGRSRQTHVGFWKAGIVKSALGRRRPGRSLAQPSSSVRSAAASTPWGPSGSGSRCSPRPPVHAASCDVEKAKLSSSTSSVSPGSSSASKANVKLNI